MQAILLFSHGSLLCGAGQTLFELAAKMEAEGVAPIVEVGFLNYSDPPFEAAFERCVERGASEIVIAPYFLVAGYFVKVSLPPKIVAMQEKFPAVAVRVADALKTHERLADAIENCAQRAQLPSSWRDILKTAPQFCRSNPQCPLFDTPQCPRQGESVIPFSGKALEKQPTATVPEATVPLPDRQTALLVMVHGSPRPESNKDMFAVVEKVRARQLFSAIEVGFMECNEPDIPTAIEKLVGDGARHVVAVPYFLHSGTHVADDLPSLLEQAQQNFPDVQFSMGDYLGRDQAIAQVVAQRAREAAILV